MAKKKSYLISDLHEVKVEYYCNDLNRIVFKGRNSAGSLVTFLIDIEDYFHPKIVAELKNAIDRKQARVDYISGRMEYAFKNPKELV